MHRLQDRRHISGTPSGLQQQSKDVLGLTQGSIGAIVSGESKVRMGYIQNLEKSLLTVGTCEEHRKKIRTLLKLIELCTLETHGENLRKVREGYFYRALMIADQYIGKNFWTETEGKEIFDTYLAYIQSAETGLGPVYTGDLKIRNLLYKVIQVESDERKTALLEEAADTDTYLSGVTRHSDTIDRIEQVFGPVRLLIISLQSGEPITLHRIKREEVESIRKSAQGYEFTLTLRIFDKLREYRVIIDHGTLEPMNRPKRSHIENIIKPILCRHIEQKEHAFTTYAYDYRKITKRVESTLVVPENPNRYDLFIKMVIRDRSDASIPPEVRDNPEYLRECRQAIDISRLLTLTSGGGKLNPLGIIESIDSILEGKMSRIVLDMVYAILLSRSEMMNGSGYPFGLSKKNIPLEARIYTIVRSYEILCEEENDLEKVRIRLAEWNQGGYFDAHIFSVFMKFLEKRGFSPDRAENPPTRVKIPPNRRNQYDHFLAAYAELRELVDKIEYAHLSFHNAAGDSSKRSRLSIETYELQALLSEKAQFSKIFAFVGHGLTESDKNNKNRVSGELSGQPGSDDECLTPDGVDSSKRKGERLKGISKTVCTSPLRRARETAGYIISNGEEKPGTYSGAIPVEGLRNPRKDLSNDRGTDAITKFITDNPSKILDFLRGSILSPVQSVYVLVAHKTTINYALGILANMGSDRIVMENVAIGEDDIEVCVIRGGRRVEWDFLFPFEDWKSVLREVNIICKRIFGEAFFSRKGGNIHLIYLHKRFLDYVDRNNEESPDKIQGFLKSLDEGMHTKHFRGVLSKSGLIF